MRRSLAGISAAVTSLVALAFLVPLALLVGDVVRDRAVADAFRTTATFGPVLAVTSDHDEIAAALAALPAASGRTCVHLPGTGGGLVPIGVPSASAAVVRDTARAGLATTAPLADGVAVLQPVALAAGRVAVVEVDVPDDVLQRGVGRARLLLGVLAVVLVLGSVALADRLAARVVRAAGRLRTASGRLGAGDLDVRLTPDGPAELREAAAAFNAMADRVGDLLAAEGERAADLSHRLRTPLAGLVLTGRSLGAGPAGDQVRALTAQLEHEVDDVIRQARDAATAPGRRPPRGRCDAVAVLRERLDFWGALAEDQDRRWRLAVTGDGPGEAPVAAAELAAAVDALLGNVFLHTPEGCGFAVEVVRTATAVEVAVGDDGAGIADPEQAVRRGTSGAGSSGLGLDIVGRVARSCGGSLTVGRSPSGGARVALVLPVRPPSDVVPVRPRRRGRPPRGRP